MRKLYECGDENCGNKVPILSKGLCTGCRKKQRIEDGSAPVYTNKIKKTKRSAKSKKEREGLPEYFQKHIEILSKNPKSEASGKFIPKPWSGNIAHILPKSNHKSVMCDDNNCMYLTLEEHTQFDELLLKFEFDKIRIYLPKVWELAEKRLPLVLQNLKENTKLSIKLEEFIYGI
mgnify:CR=1 FL=1|jgi:hypothetical protein|tara:strand:- start:1983 stop:2507 length:525 start_codon:yes stop_codon:yes gene_type:complete